MIAPILRSLPELRALTRQWQAEGAVIGAVPTMGALHEGHLGLVRAARDECDRVIVTLFVNPRQFDRPEDLANYPRTEAADAELLGPFGIDALFVPDPDEIYPPDHATTVSVGGVSSLLEGLHRPGHFDGVATIVTMLLNMTRADRAYFGEKDWQQLMVVRRLVEDLKLPVTIVPCPSVRTAEGLALSSRNRRLSADALRRAPELPAALFAAAARIERGGDVPTALSDAAGRIGAAGFSSIEYLELRDATTLQAPRAGQPARLLVAAWLDGVRLIDNVAVILPPA